MKNNFSATSLQNLLNSGPHRSRVFSRHGIDYFSGHGKRLATACREKDVDLDLVLGELEAIDREAETCRRRDWRSSRALELSRHLADFHHVYLRDEMPRLEDFISRVAAQDGRRHPELRRVRQLFWRLRELLHQHILKDELLVFPLISRLDSLRQSPGRVAVGLEGPVRDLWSDYASSEEILGELRQVTQDFHAPPDASEAESILYDSLTRLVRVWSQQVHEETDVLLPQVLAAARG